MAFLRFSRDRRGNENFYLVQPTVRRGKSRTRILYWFHTPPNVRVGRDPFDPATRKALEARYPDVMFDWKAISETPIPSADTEKWRERRRAERAQKQAALEDDASDTAAAEADSAVEPGSMTDGEGSVTDAEVSGAATASSAAVPAPAPSPSGAPAGDAPRRNRRRRRGRRGDGPRAPQSGDTSLVKAPEDSSAPAVTEPEPAGD
ncbi:MAG TPA: hypothetical protein VGH34_04820 [Vicinamibacterales bacterium]|jgi:hypothetical protein